MFDVGRVCIKTAGREKGSTAVVVDKIDDNFVLIDGGVRRRKCNILHLEPLPKIIDIKKLTSGAPRTGTKSRAKASTSEVKELLAKAGFEIPKDKKTKTPKEKAVKVRKQHRKSDEAPVKKEVKKQKKQKDE